MSRVRTRFAPSPTGSLHVGNARLAILNWAVARHHGGEFVLRIEDTDLARNLAGAEAELMEDLRWLGLEWDEGPDAGAGDVGPHSPYRQSQRLDRYDAAARSLLERGSAYRCFCTAETLEAERERARAEGRSFRYPGTCRSLDPDDAARRARAGQPHVLRLATPGDGAVVVADAIHGEVRFDAAEIGDFVLVRPDGIPTYNFAVVVDDVDMEITHVIRGAGHLSNTPHQILVYRALGAPLPVFAHAPTVLGPDRKKLSKRSGARPLRALREDGFHPDAVVNYLSLLGWSSPSGEEVLEPERIVREITLDRVGAADVVFDPDKLAWLSARHIDRMPLEDLARATRPYLVGTRFASLLDARFPDVLAAVRSHLSTFHDVVRHLDPFLGRDPEEPAPLDADGRRLAAALRHRLETLEPWGDDAIDAAMRLVGKEVGARGRSLFMPVRLALTGAEHGPPLPTVIRLQGRERALRLLADAAAERTGGV